MVVFDTATLILSVFPTANPPINPATQQPLTQSEARVNHLIEQLNNSGKVILVPTPVLTELLCGAGDKKDAFMKTFLKGNRFRVASFDQRAALELAIMLDDWKIAGKPRDPGETAAKIKLDRQIAAIGKVNGADTLYTDDDGLKKFAEKSGLKVILTWDLPLPPLPVAPMKRPPDKLSGDLFVG